MPSPDAETEVPRAPFPARSAGCLAPSLAPFPRSRRAESWLCPSLPGVSPSSLVGPLPPRHECFSSRVPRARLRLRSSKAVLSGLTQVGAHRLQGPVTQDSCSQ